MPGRRDGRGGIPPVQFHTLKLVVPLTIWWNSGSSNGKVSHQASRTVLSMFHMIYETENQRLSAGGCFLYLLEYVIPQKISYNSTNSTTALALASTYFQQVQEICTDVSSAIS